MATTIGNFEIIEKIAAGGMGVIYKARQTTLDRFVVIKELKSAFQEDAEVVARFEQEAKAVARLQHENIITVIEFWHKKGSYYIAMEYMDGADLAKIIETSGPLPLHIGLIIAVQIARALAYAHEHGVVHRDLKPSNILVSWDGRVKLVDFGIAHIEEELGGKGLTRAGFSMGTPAYMSPEQTDGKPADPSSDIWSFGCVLYEIFSGTRAFAAQGKSSMIENIRKGKRTPPTSQFTSSVPWGLRRMINRCLKLKPGKRPSTHRLMTYLARLAQKKNRGKDYAPVLKAFFDERKGRAQADIRTQVRRPERQKNKQTGKTAWMGTAVVVLVLAMAGYALFAQELRSFVRQFTAGPGGYGHHAVPRTTVTPSSGRPGELPSKAVLPLSGTAVAGALAARPVSSQTVSMRRAAELLSTEAAAAGKTGIPVTASAAAVSLTGMSGSHTGKVPAVRATGFIRVVAAPWAEVYIDGKRAGLTPTAQRFPVSAGKHKVLFKNPYYGSVMRTIDVPDNGVVFVRVTMHPERTKK